MSTMDFKDFMRALSKSDRGKAEAPIEPCIEHGAKHFAKRKEQADLEEGAVMKTLHREGQADATTPEEGDLVKFHYTIRKESSTNVVETSQSVSGEENTFSASPVLFVLGKGCRMPRGLEIAIQSMKKGEVSTFTIKPAFGFKHPDCSWRLTDASAEEEVLTFDIELVDVSPSVSVQIVNDDAIKPEDVVLKEIVSDGTGWENPRPPYRVKVLVKARHGMQGPVFFETEESAPLTFSCGDKNEIPAVLEEAIGLMFKGEVAKVYVRNIPPDSRLVPRPKDTTTPSSSRLYVYEITLLDVIQVRDVIGTKEIMKSRIKNGQGEFPIDCPIEDCFVKIHCIGRLKDTRDDQSALPFWDTGEKEGKGPFSFETGQHVTPEGLEMCVKLMVPGETSIIQCDAKYAYDDMPSTDPIAQRVPRGSDVEWEVTLVEFEKLKKLDALGLDAAIEEAHRRKAQANALFNAKSYKHAQAKYEQLVKELGAVADTSVGDPENAESNPLGHLILSCTLNLAACAQKLEQPFVALDHCNKVLEASPDNAKALYRRGQTYMRLSEFAAARRDYEHMARMHGDLKEEAEAALKKIDRLEQSALQQQKKQFQGFFNRHQ